MRAVRLASFGIENMTVDEVPDPVAAPGEVLVAAEAATVNPADVAMASGGMAGALSPSITPPYTPGWDLAGRVVAVGDGVDKALVGQRVVGFSFWVGAGHGTQASLVALPLENIAVATDDAVPSVQLTTLGLNGLTAWRAVDEVDPRPGETLVVTGAGGSVGGFALELAVARGARVIAAVPERDRAAVLALGAAEVVAREDGDLETTVRKIVPGGADALLDTARVLAAGLGAVRDGGRFITTTAVPDPERGITTTMIYGVADSPALATLVERAGRGELHMPIAREFPVDQARAAYEEFTSGPHRGRIVLTFG
jgi:NADPH2:quinone reductase